MDDPRSTTTGERTAAERPFARPGDEAAARRDEILVARALEGDLAAFNQLVEAYQDLCHSLVARLVPDPDQAADAVQEAFFSAYRNLRSYPRALVPGLAHPDRRQRRDGPPAGPQAPAGVALPGAGGRVLAAAGRPRSRSRDASTVAGERGRVLAAALAAIGTDQRAAIVLFDVEGYDYAEIAEMTGVSLGTVKSRIHRGRLALRALLAERMELFRS